MVSLDLVKSVYLCIRRICIEVSGTVEWPGSEEVLHNMYLEMGIRISVDGEKGLGVGGSKKQTVSQDGTNQN